jgi:hypothetical protein
MISSLIFVALAVFLVALLLLITNREGGEKQVLIEADERTQPDFHEVLQSPEMVFRIFSPQDGEFIFLMRSPHLLRIYQQERRAVALHWIRRTSRDAARIMQAHRLHSRQSQNLNVATEAKLFFQYLELRFICGLLGFLTKIFGPHSLNDLAGYAGNLYQLFGRALPDAAPTNRIVSSQNPATS